MGIPLAFIARTGALDDASLEAQLARWDALLAHFVQEGLTQCGTQPVRGLHQTPLTALDDVDSMHKTDFIRVPVGLPPKGGPSDSAAAYIKVRTAK